MWEAALSVQLWVDLTPIIMLISGEELRNFSNDLNLGCSNDTVLYSWNWE